MTAMSYTYTDPTGQTYLEIPEIWGYQGCVHAIAGDWRRAERLGWTRSEVQDRFSVTKLTVRRFCREHGMEDALDAAIATTKETQADWADAQVLRSDDPILTGAMPLFAAALGVPETEAWSLLRQAAEEADAWAKLRAVAEGGAL